MLYRQVGLPGFLLGRLHIPEQAARLSTRGLFTDGYSLQFGKALEDSWILVLLASDSAIRQMT